MNFTGIDGIAFKPIGYQTIIYYQMFFGKAQKFEQFMIVAQISGNCENREYCKNFRNFKWNSKIFAAQFLNVPWLSLCVCFKEKKMDSEFEYDFFYLMNLAYRSKEIQIIDIELLPRGGQLLELIRNRLDDFGRLYLYIETITK